MPDSTRHQAWFGKVDEDLQTILLLLEGKSWIPWSVVCFHAQQAAEKSLKGFLVFHGQLPQQTHNLIFLLSTCTQIEPSLSSLRDDCRTLTPQAFISRYPHDLVSADEAEARTMVAACGRIRTAILELLPAENP